MWDHVLLSEHCLQNVVLPPTVKILIFEFLFNSGPLNPKKLVEKIILSESFELILLL